MKRVVILTMAVVVLMGISDKAFAGPWTRSAFGLGARHRSIFGIGSSHRYGYRPTLGRSSWTRSAFGLGGYGRYGRYGRYGFYGRDRTLRRVTGYGGLALDALQVLNQSSIDKQLVNHQISVDNRMVSMAERDQQIRAQNGTVLVKRGPIILQVTKPEQTQSQKNQELQQRIRILELELQKLELQQQAKK